MRLRFVEFDLRAGLERVIDMETGAAKIVAGQTGGPVQASPGFTPSARTMPGPGVADAPACRPIARIKGLIWKTTKGDWDGDKDLGRRRRR